MTSAEPDLHTSPLHERHVALGAKLADFGGWHMPIEYSGTGGGVLVEHQAVREQVGVFDVSHLGKAVVRGAGAAEFVNATLSNDLDRIAAGMAQYTLCCDDETGGIVDDLIVYLRGPDEVFLIPNAANAAEVIARLQAAAPAGLEVASQHLDFGIIAVQGPSSASLLQLLDLPTDHDYMAFTEAAVDGIGITVCRTGYTGEHGYELVVPWDATEQIWDLLLERGVDLGARACGLGARDTLRTEMGYPLHGQDLSIDVTPNQARIGWAVGWQKPRFWGREVLLEERAQKPHRLLWGLRATGRGIPRPGMPVRSTDGEVVGEVTTGTFSPTLRYGIALAMLERSAGLGEDAEVVVDVRGRPLEATVVKPPFVPSHVR